MSPARKAALLAHGYSPADILDLGPHLKLPTDETQAERAAKMDRDMARIREELARRVKVSRLAERAGEHALGNALQPWAESVQAAEADVYARIARIRKLLDPRKRVERQYAARIRDEATRLLNRALVEAADCRWSEASGSIYQIAELVDAEASNGNHRLQARTIQDAALALHWCPAIERLCEVRRG